MGCRSEDLACLQLHGSSPGRQLEDSEGDEEVHA